MHKIKQVNYNTKDYEKVLNLRDKILRKPMGLNLFDEDLTVDRNQYIFGLFDDNNLLACVQYRKINKKELKLRQMAVDIVHQKKGLGSLLIKSSENILRERGYEKIILHARETAVDFYKKSGYKVVSKLFFEIGIPHYKMCKYL